MIEARREIESIVGGLVDEHIKLLNEASTQPKMGASLHLDARMAANGKSALPASYWGGVAPGSFVDLLVTKGIHDSSETFSSECITQQVSHSKLTGS